MSQVLSSHSSSLLLISSPVTISSSCCYSHMEPSPTFSEIDHNLDLMSQFEQLNGSVMENCNLGLTDFSNDNFLPFLGNFADISPVECPELNIEPHTVDRKTTAAVALSGSNSMNSSATTTETKKKNRSGSRKRGRSSSKSEVEDPKEVVHVRARRGQATDSHSLAERVRREKINERMRFLQGLVPGCYKAMGMAGTLHEIINYVQSLQNQVEFLSMKLSAASSFYGFSSDMEAMAAAPQVLPRDGDAYLEAVAMERLVTGDQGYGECTSFPSTMPF